MKRQNKLVKKLVEFGKKHPRLCYPIIALIGFILVGYHGIKQYWENRQKHFLRQQFTAFAMMFALLLTTVGIVWAVAEGQFTDRNTEQTNPQEVQEIAAAASAEADGSSAEREFNEGLPEQGAPDSGEDGELTTEQSMPETEQGETEHSGNDTEIGMEIQPGETETSETGRKDTGIIQEQHNDTEENELPDEIVNDEEDADADPNAVIGEGQAIVPAEGLETESLTLTSLFSSGSSATNFSISDSNTFQVTVALTGGAVDSPVLELIIPRAIDITHYPDETNVTLAPQLLAGSKVDKKLDSSGNTILTYRFSKNIIQAGFNVTLKPTYKLKDDNTYQVTANYYNGTQLLRTEQNSVKVTNRTVKLNAISPSSSTNTVTLNGSANYDVALKPYIYGTSGHYVYSSVTIVVPLPDEAIPGFGKGSAFQAMSNGVTNAISSTMDVKYQKSYTCQSIDGTVNKTCQVLIFTIKGNHSFLSGDYSATIDGNIYLRYSGVTAATYTPGIGTRISIVYDFNSNQVVHDFFSTSSSYYNFANVTFKEYNLDDDFYLEARASSNYSTTYVSYVYPLEDKAFYTQYITNGTASKMNDVIIEYKIPQELYARKVTFILSNIGSTKAEVSYKTKAGGDTVYNKTLTQTDNILSLEDKTDAVTYMKVTYDFLNKNLQFTGLVKIPFTNADNIVNASKSVTAQILSAKSDSLGSISAREKYSLQYNLLTNTPIAGAVTLSKSTLNKGDTFSIIGPSSSSTYYDLKNQVIHCLMPKEYIFIGYDNPASTEFNNAAYTVTQREIGDNILYTVRYTDNVERFYKRYNNCEGNFNFRVGPLVDTSQVRTETLPKGMFYENNHPVFPYNTTTAAYMAKESTLNIDINGDGDMDDIFSKPSSYPSATINSVNALSVEGYLSSDNNIGEDVKKDYFDSSSGNYHLLIYNGLASGTSVSDMSITIALPRKGSTMTVNGTDYTSDWDVYLKSPVTLDGDFWNEAAIEYSTDNGDSYTSELGDYSSITHIRVASKPGLALAGSESASINLSFETGFNADMSSLTKTYKAYFGTTMTYTDSLLNTITTAAVTPSELVAQGMKPVTGTLFYDYNADGTKDNDEIAAAYELHLYEGSSTAGTPVQTIAVDETTGEFAFGIMKQGTFTLKASKGEDDFYPEGNSYFNSDGEYTFIISSESADVTENLNLGLWPKRTISLNLNETTVLEGETAPQIVPTLTPARLSWEGNVSFATSDPGIVTVAADGTLNWVGVGSAVITVTAPQLPGAISLGEEDTVTATVAVECRRPGCFITAQPYFDPDCEAILQEPETGSLTETYTYYYERSGYCNNSTHSDTKTVNITIKDAGETDAVISMTANTAEYGQAELTVSRPGTIILEAIETWGHGAENQPEPVTFTIVVLARTISAPIFSIEPEEPDGENGWYQSLPEITLTQTQEGESIYTVFNRNGSAYRTLSEQEQPAITESGIYGFMAHSIESNYQTQSADASLTGIKVDTVKPSVTNVTEPANNIWRTSQTIDFKAGDDTSGVAAAVVKLDDEVISCSAVSAGNYRFVATANGDYKITVTDNAGNEKTTTVTISKIDTTAPFDVYLTGMDEQKRWMNQDVTLEVHAADEESGILKYIYSLDGGQTFSDFIDWNANGKNTFQIKKNGNYTDVIVVKAFNQAGLDAQSDIVTVKLDKVKPKLHVTAKNDGKFTNKDVIFKLDNGVTNISGVTYFVKKTTDKKWTALTDSTKKTFGIWDQATNTLTVTENTNAKYIFRIVSGAGLEDENGDYIVKIQKTTAKPYIFLDVTTRDKKNAAGWYRQLTLNVKKRVVNADEAAITTYYKLYLKGTKNPKTNKLTGKTIPVPQDGENILEIWTKDEAGNKTAAYQASYRVDGTPGEITVNDGNPEKAVNHAVKIKATLTDLTSGISERKIKLQKKTGIFKLWVSDFTCTKTEEGIVVEYIAEKNGEYKIAAVDIAGNKSTVKIVIDKIDTRKPELITIDCPSHMAKDVELTETLRFTVDEPVETGSDAYLHIYDMNQGLAASISAADELVTISTAGGNSTVTVQLPEPLSKDTTYYVKVDKGFVQDIPGNKQDAFGGKYSWRFSTIPAAPQINPPKKEMPVMAEEIPAEETEAVETERFETEAAETERFETEAAETETELAVAKPQIAEPPASEPPADKAGMAILNIVLLILTAATAIISFRRVSDKAKVLTCALPVVSLILFLVTQPFGAGFVWIDKFTVLFTIIAVAELFGAFHREGEQQSIFVTMEEESIEK